MPSSLPTMKQDCQFLFKTSPFLFLLISSQVLLHDNIAWTLGTIAWLMTSRLYLIPRRMQDPSGRTIPSLLGHYYNYRLQILIGTIYTLYVILLLVKIIQAWYALHYIVTPPQAMLWILLVAWLSIMLYALVRKRSLLVTIAGSLFMVSLLLLPLLAHYLFFQHQKEVLLNLASNQYTTYLNTLNPSILLIASLFGHPFLSYSLLDNQDKKQKMRSFKLLGTTLICFAIIKTIVVQKLLNPSDAMTHQWQLIITLYQIATYLLSGLYLLYTLSLHFSYDIIRPLWPEINVKTKYTLTALLSLIVIGLSYLLTPNITEQILHFSTTLLILSQAIALIIIIGLPISIFNFYLALFNTSLISLLLISLGPDFIQPYSLFIEVIFPLSILLTIHYIKNEGLSLRKRNWWEKQEIAELALKASHIKKAVLTILLFPFNIASYARRSLACQRITYRSLNLYLSLIGLLGLQLWPLKTASTPIYILFLSNLLLTAVLLLQSFWPCILAPYYALYWYFWLTSYLIVLPIILYFTTAYNPITLINLILSLLLVARFITPISFLTMNMLGLTTTIASLLYFAPHLYYDLVKQPQTLHLFLYSYLLTTLVGIFFIRKNKSELNETKEKLQALVQKSTAIVSNTLNITQSHGSIINLCIENMDATEEPDEEGKTPKVLITMEHDAYQAIKENTAKLLTSINTSKAQLKRMFLPIYTIKNLPCEPCQASPCVKEAIAIFIKDYEPPKKPQLQIEQDFTFMGSDKNLIAVIIQLLVNSHEYSQAQGDITLHIKNNKIYITNSESTIPTTELPHIFNQFFTTKSNNLGLGLFFVKQIMDTFNGSINVVLNTKNKKTSFVLSFPTTH